MAASSTGSGATYITVCTNWVNELCTSLSTWSRIWHRFPPTGEWVYLGGVVNTARPTGDPPLAAPIVPSTPRPVVLATLSVRVDPRAERMAIESAAQTRAPLILANMWIVGDS